MITFTGPRVWMQGERPEPSPLLVQLAIMATTDPSAIPVLDDAMIEAGWDHPAIMPMVLGIELDDPDRFFSTSQARSHWNRRMERAHHGAANAAGVYRGRSAIWVRAVLAAMLFGAWPHRMTATHGTRSPFPLIRRMHRAGSIVARRSPLADLRDFTAVET